MYSKVLIVIAVAALASANDIHEGINKTQELKPFFEGRYEAQWALTRPTKDVFVNTSGVITGINVTDLRQAKDGEATIVSGGVGHSNVTISLKSPAVFRGYDYLVEVYSDEEVERGSRSEPSLPEVTVSDESKASDKPITGKPEMPIDKSGATSTGTADVTSTTGKPGVTLTTTTGKLDVTLTTTTGKLDVTLSPVPVPTGKPELTGLPTAPKGVEVPEVPENVEDMPMKTKIGFQPPTTHF